jgi:predicted nucleic acid-binding protein
VILLDTNVISEPLRPAPDAKAVAWLRKQNVQSLYLSTITIAELHAGLEIMPKGKRKEALREGILRIEESFEGRILSLDHAAAVAFGPVIARTKPAGNPIAFGDAAIAAIAIAHGFSIATRDVKDFRATGVKIIDPWS